MLSVHSTEIALQTWHMFLTCLLVFWVQSTLTKLRLNVLNFWTAENCIKNLLDVFLLNAFVHVLHKHRSTMHEAWHSLHMSTTKSIRFQSSYCTNKSSSSYQFHIMLPNYKYQNKKQHFVKWQVLHTSFISLYVIFWPAKTKQALYVVVTCSWNDT